MKKRKMGAHCHRGQQSLTTQPELSQRPSKGDSARQSAPGEKRCSWVPEPYSRNDWLASWGFHIAPPCVDSTSVQRQSVSHPEGHTPRLA